MTVIYLILFFSAAIFIFKLFLDSQKKVNYLRIIEKDHDVAAIEKVKKEIIIIFGKIIVIMVVTGVLIISIAYFYSCYIGKCWGT